MNKKVKFFLGLAEEHPDLPVIPFVDGAVVSEDKCAAFIGDFGASRVGEFLEYDGVAYDNRGDFIADWQDNHHNDAEFCDMNEQELEDYAINFCDKQDWKKVICLYIDIFKGEVK